MMFSARELREACEYIERVKGDFPLDRGHKLAFAGVILRLLDVYHAARAQPDPAGELGGACQRAAQLIAE